jgi:hypothetical protein
VRRQLSTLVSAWREQRSVPDLLIGIGLVVLATVVVYVIVRLLLFARRRLTR